MNNITEILELLGIPSSSVHCFETEIDKTTGISNIYIELFDIKGICPRCKSRDIGIKDYYDVRIKNSVTNLGKIYVHIRMRRYVCKTCGKTFKQSFDFYTKRKSISITVRQAILEDLKQPLTYLQIARKYDVSSTFVIDLFDSLNEPRRFPLTPVICIDEFHFAGNPSGLKYPCVITEPYTGTILDVIKTRRKDWLFEYFSQIPEKERSQVRYFITDMYEVYRTCRKRFFPNAIHVVDRFHIAKLFTEAIQSVRKTIMNKNEYKSKEYLFLKKNWKLFVMNRARLKELKYTDKYGVVYDYVGDVDLVLRKYPELNQVYQTRNEFFSRCHTMLWNEAKRHVDFYITSLKYSPILELQKISKTLQNWEYEVTNAFARSSERGNLSNAIAEATNNVIQTYSDIGYGFKNYSRFRKRILYMNRNKTKND